jgi:hypothetical protein
VGADGATTEAGRYNEQDDRGRGAGGDRSCRSLRSEGILDRSTSQDATLEVTVDLLAGGDRHSAQSVSLEGIDRSIDRLLALAVPNAIDRCGSGRCASLEGICDHRYSPVAWDAGGDR